MSNAITLQADMGSLGLQGLSSFSTLLAAFSADNVSAAAMLQMEKLGSMFLLSGPHAERVPDLLQRFSSTRFERLALTVGWRKDDSAAIMSQSTSGQAIALLSYVLMSLYKDNIVGQILREISRRLLVKTDTPSSISQLRDVAKMLDSKISPIGFGNVLANKLTEYTKPSTSQEIVILLSSYVSLALKLFKISLYS